MYNIQKSLSTTEQYEQWRVQFAKKIQDSLPSIFSKYYDESFSTFGVKTIDKWSIEVCIHTMDESMLTDFLQNKALLECLQVSEDISCEIGDFFKVKIYAKTEKELELKLLTIKLLLQ